MRFSIGFGVVCVATACGGSGGAASEPALANAREAAPAGARVYATQCADCHGDSGQGIGTSPAVMGESALALRGAERSEFKTAADLFDYLKANMPLPKKKAGSLSDAEYYAVTAYLLAASGRKVPEKLAPDNAASVIVNP